MYKISMHLHTDQFWSLYPTKEIMELEKVQRGANEMIKETEKGLKSLRLFSTEKRWLKKDVVKVYRVMKGEIL